MITDSVRLIIYMILMNTYDTIMTPSFKIKFLISIFSEPVRFSCLTSRSVMSLRHPRTVIIDIVIELLWSHNAVIMFQRKSSRKVT